MKTSIFATTIIALVFAATGAQADEWISIKQGDNFVEWVKVQHGSPVHEIRDLHDGDGNLLLELDVKANSTKVSKGTHYSTGSMSVQTMESKKRNTSTTTEITYSN